VNADDAHDAVPDSVSDVALPSMMNGAGNSSPLFYDTHP